MGIGFNKQQNSKGQKSSNINTSKGKTRSEYDLSSNLKTVGENGQSRNIPQRNVNPKQQPKYDDSVFDDEDEYYEEVVQKPNKTNRNKNRQLEEQPKKKSNVLIIVLLVLIVIGMLGGFLLLSKQNNQNNEKPVINNPSSVIPDASDSYSDEEEETEYPNNTTESNNQNTTQESSATGTLIKENDDGTTSTIQGESSTTGSSNETSSATAGIPDFKLNTNMKSDSPVTDYSEFVKNLEGGDVKVDYTVSRIDTKQDFVNYKKYRTVTGTGLELYWLDVVYKDRNYTMTVPFKIYKELDDVGIVPVVMEVLVLTDNSEIISHMEVDTEYKGGSK